MGTLFVLMNYNYDATMAYSLVITTRAKRELYEIDSKEIRWNDRRDQ
jgi:hypothetical protein